MTDSLGTIPSDDSPGLALDVRHVWHSFPAQPESLRRRSGQVLLALKDISLSVQSGQFVSLVGASGCGKSTLLRLLAGLLEPSAGEVLLARQLPRQWGPPAVMRAEKQISWMSQQAALLPWRTVLENVTLPLQINAQKERKAVAPPEELLRLVNLSEFSDVYPHTLSGGMQQRVALARALATGAALWLMDEPFAALDELTREMLAQELLAIWRRFSPTVVWVTHNLHEAIRLSDRVLVMTPRPGTIAGEVVVDLPHRRDDTGLEFQEKLRQARALLQQEPLPR